MKLPPIPVPVPIESITPSFYNAAARCMAQAAWGRFGERHGFPVSPFALLGGAFHAVTEEAAQGAFPSEPAARRDAAYAHFETEANRLLGVCHPFVRHQFASASALPYFYRQQAQAGEVAASFISPSPAGDGQRNDVRTGLFAERKLTSLDGAVTGRVDLLDASARVVYDYKSGSDPGSPTESEIRQMRLYAFLCAENGMSVERAVIVRRNHRQDNLIISTEEAAEEGAAAAQSLREFNVAIPGGFQALASPAPATCGGCRCLPLCERFWEAAAPEWTPETGAYAEGEVEHIQRSATGGGASDWITLQIFVRRGSVSRGRVTLPPIPAWAAEADGDKPLNPGDRVRVVGTKIKSTGGDAPSLFDAMRTKAPEIWLVEAAC